MTAASVELTRGMEAFEEGLARQQAGAAAPLAGKVAINIERSLWFDLLREPLGRYYRPEPDPDYQVQIQMRMQLYALKHFPLVAPALRRWVFPDVGLALLPSLFGAPVSFREDIEPAWENAIVLGDDDPLPEQIPNWQTAGLMPAVLDCHRRMGELLGEAWQVGMPDWCRGPLGTMAYLRGQENTYIDLVQAPERARRVMEYCQRARFAWLRGRASVLGEATPGPAVLFNDDVSAENMSRKRYREQVWPFEKECYDFHHGRLGYHSCGDLTPFLEDIRELGPLDFFHVSAWTNLEAAVRCFHPQTHLLVTLHPFRDVLAATPEHVERRIREIRDACGGGPYTIMMTELMRCDTPEKDQAALQRALEIAAKLLC